MRYSSLTIAVVAAPLAAAAPTKRQQTPLSENDINVLQLAHYLENLELSLYSGGYVSTKLCFVGESALNAV